MWRICYADAKCSGCQQPILTGQMLYAFQMAPNRRYCCTCAETRLLLQAPAEPPPVEVGQKAMAKAGFERLREIAARQAPAGRSWHERGDE